MNRVQTVTQKHYRVEKPGQKPNRLHEPPTGPASAPGARARAVSWPAQRRIVAELPGRIAATGCRVMAPQCRIASIVSLAPAAVPRAPCPAPLRALPRAPARRAVRVVGLHGGIVGTVPRASAVSWACAVRAPGRVVA